ncbi:unnamed protein product [Phytomonas sp. EM1]|nr:unnamed protein product [Phytomonas sp. EM1]|eukprot:CCW61354.1 unnamed protein product [Phytomonas sp. isolate EM1]
MRNLLDAELDATNTAHRMRPHPPVTSVLDNQLFIGGLPDNEALQILRKEGVKHIINCCAQEYLTDPLIAEEFHAHNLECYDTADYFILHHDYEPFAKLLMNILQKQEKVFVHCIGGINRSVTLCCTFLMEMLQISPVAAVKKLRKNGRMYILDNVSFRHQLVDFYFQVVLPRINEEEVLHRA